VGFYKNADDLCANWVVDQTWNPALNEQKRAEMYRMWKKAVTRSFDWVE
jgi:glycerol kinase